MNYAEIIQGCKITFYKPCIKDGHFRYCLSICSMWGGPTFGLCLVTSYFIMIIIIIIIIIIITTMF